jgi:hypothetical protein
MKRIGDDRREAIDWVQDRLLLTRPEAEFTMNTMLKEHIAITTDDGIFLTEEEDEAEEKGKRFSKRFNRRVNRRRVSKKTLTKNVRKLGKQFNNKVPSDDDDKDKDK